MIFLAVLLASILIYGWALFGAYGLVQFRAVIPTLLFTLVLEKDCCQWPLSLPLCLVRK